jgi:hypothetical protein
LLRKNKCTLRGLVIWRNGQQKDDNRTGESFLGYKKASLP